MIRLISCYWTSNNMRELILDDVVLSSTQQSSDIAATYILEDVMAKNAVSNQLQPFAAWKKLNILPFPRKAFFPHSCGLTSAIERSSLSFDPIQTLHCRGLSQLSMLPKRKCCMIGSLDRTST